MPRLRSFAAAAAAFIAAAAPAQPPEEPATEESGLSDLTRTVEALSAEEAANAQSLPESEVIDTGETAPSDEPASEAQTDPSIEAQAPARPTGSTPPPPLEASQEAQIARAVARGRQLFAIARAGMLATQDMLSRVADPESAGIEGWVAEPEGNAMGVTFYADGEEGPVAVYRARILGGRTVSRDTFLTGERPPLAGMAERMARARAASESDEHRACTEQPFNVLAIPASSPDEPVHVYRISAPESRTRLPLGGHYRAAVSSDGEVTESRSFSRGCLNVDIGEVPAGAQPGPIAITHLLDDLPTEIHVFLSLFSGRPLVIAAGDPTRLFMVAGDAVREIRR